MHNIDNQSEDSFLRGWNVLLGAGVIVAPWYVGLASEASASWSACVFGASVVALASSAMRQTREWEVYAAGGAGLRSCVAT